MNDIESIKHIKRMKRLGISDDNARDIIDCISETGYDDAEKAIEYAIKLIYGYSIDYSKSKNFS